MRLSAGDKAPPFEAVTADGARWRLADHCGARLWLAFMRYSGCPLCHLRVHEMSKRARDYGGRGLRLAAVVQSPRETASRNLCDEAPVLPVLCDPEERVYALYGCEASVAGFLDPRNVVELTKATAAGYLPRRPEGTVTRLPADFLIESDGTIGVAHYSERIGEHIPFEAVDAFVSREAGTP